MQRLSRDYLKTKWRSARNKLPTWLPARQPDPMFQVVLIETQNSCTRTCGFCKFGLERQDPGRAVISDGIIQKIARDLQRIDYAGRISPFGINEPLLEPRIFDIIALFRQACPKAAITIASNGDCLNSKVYDRLFAAGLDYLFVDAYDDKALEKVEKFRQFANVTINDMRHPDPTHLENRAGSVPGDEKRAAERQSSNCLRPSSMVFIRPPGQVVLCCSDMYSDRVMGDLRHDSIVDIWQNQLFCHYRETLAREGRKNLQMCQNCSYVGKPALRGWSTPEQHRKWQQEHQPVTDRAD